MVLLYVLTVKTEESVQYGCEWMQRKMIGQRQRTPLGARRRVLLLLSINSSNTVTPSTMSFMNKLQQGLSKAGEQAAALGSGLQKQVGSNQGVQGITSNFTLEKE